MAIMDTAAAPIIDLISLIEQRGASRLRYAASTDNGEYWGACPFCGGGTKRFHVWPHSARPHYWCRDCDAKGDAIQFLRDYEDMSFKEACDELGIESGDYMGTPAPASSDQAPPKKWIDIMQYIVETGNRHLLAGSTVSARQYQQYLADRAISLATIEKKRIAFTAPGPDGRWLEIPFSDAGITEDMVPAIQWKKGCIRVPDGLIFPYYVGGDLWKLGIKRPFVTDGTMQRGQILGSKECLLNEDLIRPDRPVVMAEAFLDAVSIEQVAGDLVVAVSTDGTSNGRSARCIMRLKYAAYVLQCFDSDPAGHAAALWWCSTLQNCIGYPVSHGKDANEMLQAGHDVRAWIVDAIAFASTFSPMPVSPTIIEQSSPVQHAEPTSLSTTSVVDIPYVCAICWGEVERFTTKGTGCCYKHYDAQQQIEALLDTYQTEPPSTEVLQQPMLTPAELQQKYISGIQEVLGKCEVQIYPGEMTRKQIIALRMKEIQQGLREYDSAMHRKETWNAVQRPI